MKKFLLAGGLLIAWGLGVMSCSDDDEPGMPQVVVNGLTFADTDDEAQKIGGDLAWNLPETDAGITGFIIYGSEDGTARTTKIGETAASLSQYTVAAGTAYTPYLLVVTKNGAGEALAGASVAVRDSILVPPASVVSAPVFTDTDSRKDRIGGELSWTAPQQTGGIEAYRVYASPDGAERSVLLGEAALGTNRFEVPANTAFTPYLVIVAKNREGEAAEQAKVSVYDAYTGFYLLHSGKMYSNNSSLGLYTLDAANYRKDIFADANGKGLGDTANDMVLYGSKIYVAVSGSNLIYVLDREGNILKEIRPEEGGAPEKPRYAAPYGGKVYVSMYSGYVACVDTVSLEIEKRVKVGAYPEQLVAAGGKLYVTNSDYTGDGTGKTVSVIALPGFTREKDIEVVQNPTEIAADATGNVYVISMGNYGDILNTLQKIDPATGAVTTIANATKMAVGREKIYLMYSQYDADWNQTISYFTYDLAAGTVNNASFITDGTAIAKPYMLSANSTTGEVMVTESDYTNTGAAYLFNSNGRLIRKIADTQGLNPVKACFF